MQTTLKILSSTGRLINRHFMLVADQLEFEVDPTSHELLAAHAVGNVTLYTMARHNHAEYVIHAAGAIYRPQADEVTFQGWTATLENGTELLAENSMTEAFLPTDGSFFFPKLPEQSTTAKRLQVLHPVKLAA